MSEVPLLEGRVYSWQHFVTSCVIMIAAVLSAMIAAWCLFPLASLPLGAALLAAAVAGATPLWPDQEIENLLIEGPPLAPLVPSPMKADFSTPGKAAETVFESARAGDIESVKRGLSKRLRDKIDELQVWDKVMEHLGERAVLSSSDEWPPIPNGARISRQTASGIKTLRMLREGDIWQLNELPFYLEYLRR